MAEKMNVPEIRFAGFTEPWEQKKLGEATKIFKSGDGINSNDINETDLFPVFGGNGLRGYTSTYNHDGEFALIGRQGALCGNMNFSYGKAYFTEHAIAVQANQENDTRFLYYLLRTMNLGQYSDQSAQPGLAVNKLIDLCAFIPMKAEQKRIQLLCSISDNLISLHQKKHTQLMTIKKAMLEKMYPKEGEIVPGIRFASFSTPWQKKSFSDITFPSGIKNHDNLPLESYSITNEYGFIPQNEKFENGGTMRDADKRMYYIVSPNSFAYNPARINVGSIGYQNIGKDVIVSSLYEIFKTTSDVDDRFLWHWFKSNDFQKLIFQLQEGGVRLYFYYDKLRMGSLALPELREQYLIGKYLDGLDDLITLQQKKIDKLQHIKKAFLDKMFV